MPRPVQNAILFFIGNGTSNATPGVHTTITHNLGTTPNKTQFFIQGHAIADNTNDTAAAWEVVKTSSTTVSVKCSKASTPFVLFGFLTEADRWSVPSFPTL